MDRSVFQHDRGGVALRGQKVEIAEDGEENDDPDRRPRRVAETSQGERLERLRDHRQGAEVILEINGVVMSHAIDRDAKLACRQGVIALQMHPGPPMKVQFRDLRIKILD